MAGQRLLRQPQRILYGAAMDHQRTRGMLTGSHQELACALSGDQGNIRHRLYPREAWGLLVIGRSPGEKGASVWLTSEGQKWVSRLAGSCD
jgi:hypothetical protein